MRYLKWNPCKRNIKFWSSAQLAATSSSSAVTSKSLSNIMKIDRVPHEGETIHSKTMEKALGGKVSSSLFDHTIVKGANQAVACGRLGANVEMLVQLGNDEVGHQYMKNFKENNVRTDHAKILEGVASGQAYILSLANGNNAIIIVGGSNEEYDPNMTELDPSWA